MVAYFVYKKLVHIGHHYIHQGMIQQIKYPVKTIPNSTGIKGLTEETQNIMKDSSKFTKNKVASLVNVLMANVIKTNNQFQCHLCKKIFNDTSKMKRHLLSHTGIKPVQCTKCSSSFLRREHLKRHMKTLHNE